LTSFSINGLILLTQLGPKRGVISGEGEGLREISAAEDSWEQSQVQDAAPHQAVQAAQASQALQSTEDWRQALVGE